MNKTTINSFASLQRFAAAAVYIVALFFTMQGCENLSPNAQENDDWTSGAKWIYKYSGQGEKQFVFTVEKDTVIDGKSCRIIRGENSKDIVYEENGRVYYYFDNKFRKIYDFNVNVGDIVEFEFKTKDAEATHLNTTMVLPFRIERISTVIIDGVELREIAAFYAYDGDYYWDYRHVYLEKMGIESLGRHLEGIFPVCPDCVVPAIHQTRLLWYKDTDIEYIGDWNDYILDWWTVRLIAKENYPATKDPEIKALSLKHGVTFRQSFPDATTQESLLHYDLTGKGRTKENTIKDFLVTGKFHLL
jgi:hypothetical protein